MYSTLLLEGDFSGMGISRNDLPEIANNIDERMIKLVVKSAEDIGKHGSLTTADATSITSGVGIQGHKTIAVAASTANEMMKRVVPRSIQQKAMSESTKIVKEDGVVKDASVIAKFAIGIILIVLFVLILVFIFKKKQYGDLYTLRDLMGEAISFLKEKATEGSVAILNKLGGILATALASTICVFLLMGLLNAFYYEKLPSPIKTVIDYVSYKLGFNPKEGKFKADIDEAEKAAKVAKTT